MAQYNLDKIIKGFNYSEWSKDPVIHFYETFIKYFDPKEKSHLGIFYTPDPVVDYIVNSVDFLLKNEKNFKKELGLASKNVTLLDPAAGTSTFLIKSLTKAHNNMLIAGMKGKAGKHLGNHVVPNFFGMEILLAPYVISHLKISRVLEELTIDNSQDKGFNLYLTNTLSMEEGVDSELPFMKELYLENKKALSLKKEKPVMVIIGNPPYSISSSSTGKDFIDDLIKPYKDLNGKKEQNVRALTNDYVKFIRWAEWKISQNVGGGIVGMITSNSYLSGVNFRGMRHHLLKSFDKIYILNLNGDNRIERVFENEKDENVFDIKEGVSIIFGIKDDSKTSELGELYYKEIIGSRSKKYLHLLNKNISNDNFVKLNPSEPYYVFKPFEMEDMHSTMPLDEVFLSKYHGITTHRDHFLVSHDKEALLNNIHSAASRRKTVEQTLEEFDLHDTRDWNAVDSISSLKKIGMYEDKCKSYSYRPFFNSYIYNDPCLIEFERPQMQNDLEINNNKFLIIGRSGQAVSGQWDLVFSASQLVDKNFFYRGGAYCFPLNNNRKQDLISYEECNINPLFIKKIEETTKISNLKNTDVFFYILGLLNHKDYLDKYQNQLQVDFPPIPYPSKNEFLLYWEYGELIDELFNEGISKKDFEVKLKLKGNDNLVSNINADNDKIYINKSTFIENLTPAHMLLSHGGYPIIEKYLKDFKKHNLELNSEKIEMISKALNTKLIYEEVKLDIVEDFALLRSSNTKVKPLRDRLMKKIDGIEKKLLKLKAS
jgi:predicted helicase